MSNSDPKVIRIFQSPIKAEMAQAILEEEEIPCRLDDLHLSALDPVLGAAGGGVKLLVPPDRVEDALKVLKDTSSDDFEFVDEEERLLFEYEGDWASESDGPSMRTSDLVCPECGSQDIGYPAVVHWFWSVILLLGGIGLLFPAAIGVEWAGTLMAIAGVLLTIAIALAVFHRYPFRCKDCEYQGLRKTFGYELDD